MEHRFSLNEPSFSLFNSFPKVHAAKMNKTKMLTLDRTRVFVPFFFITHQFRGSQLWHKGYSDIASFRTVAMSGGYSATVPATMKAAVVEEFGKPLVIKSVPVPEPGHGEVLVKVIASGDGLNICGTN